MEIFDKMKEFIQTWSKKKVNGQSFDVLFKIEGKPVWWFYNRFFLPHVMPKQINTLGKNDLTIIQKTKYLLMSGIFPKVVYLNELKKIRKAKRIKRFSKDKKALFLTYSNHILEDHKIFRIQKVIDNLVKVKPFPLFACPLSSADVSKIKEKDNIYSYFDEEISREARVISNELAIKYKSLDKKTKKLMLKDGKKSYWPILRYPLNSFFSKEFLYLVILYYLICKKIIVKQNVKVVVLTAQNGLFEKCLLAAANELKIKSVFIQHGMALGDGLEDLSDFSKVAVFSRYYEDKIGSDNAEAVGPVIFDDIARFRKIPKPNKKHILMITSPIVEDLQLDKKKYFVRVDKVIKSVKRFEGYLTIKLHPREKLNMEYQKILKKCKLEAKILKNLSKEEYYKLISNSDIIINFGSTAAIEAMIVNRPILTINLDNRKNNQVINSRCTMNITYLDDIFAAIDKTIKQDPIYVKKRNDFIKRYCYKIDGNCGLRVARLIERLA
ncbi:MAG: hypothetical protein KJ601_07045 [Nanoarchaeota archaeon]|nr:hypothetical protein [Nanoarchaeota archaeon]